MDCRYCEQPLAAERAEVRDYCMADACVKEGLKARKVRVVAVPVHKSIPMLTMMYTAGEHLDARRNR